MNKQPEALRLADALERYDICSNVEAMPDLDVVASELRRLHKFERSGEKLRRRFVKATFAKKELLEALKHLEHNARKSGADMGLALDVASAAIAKAEDE